MAITLRILLWAHDGAEDLLVRYEDRALEIASAHGGEVLSRRRGDGAPGSPTEVQVLRFVAEENVQAFMDDPARQALASMRDQAVARTEVIRGDPAS